MQVKTDPGEAVPSLCGVGRAQEEGNQEKVVQAEEEGRAPQAKGTACAKY